MFTCTTWNNWIKKKLTIIYGNVTEYLNMKQFELIISEQETNYSIIRIK